MQKGSVFKTFKILDHFTSKKPEWGVTELANALGTNKSTTYRFLSDLQQVGVIQKDEISGKYCLGLKLFELGNRVQLQQAFIEKSHAELIKLAEAINETVHIGILRDKQVFYIDKVDCPQGLKLNSAVGSYAPLHATSLGKILLAFTDDDLDKAMDMHLNGRLESHTNNTIVDRSKLKAALTTIKKTAYAIDREEFEIGLISLAVPIFNEDKHLVAGLCASGPANRFKENQLNNYVAILQEGAQAIKKNIQNFKF